MKKLIEQKIHHFEWQDSWEGLRASEVIRLLVPAISSRQAVMAVVNGLATVDGRPLEDLGEAIPKGSTLSIDLRHGIKGETKPRHGRLIDRMRVLHDDEQLVVVSKAAGVVVQPTEDETAAGRPLIELLKHFWRAKEGTPINLTVVHRLDKETSGVLVLAKTVEAGRHLQRQAGGRFMERRYLALVEGIIEGEKGVWDSFIGLGPNKLRQNIPLRQEGGADAMKGIAQHAVTHWRVVERFTLATLLELRLDTGRTHQIRIHAAEAGHPVVGDKVYVKLAQMRFPEMKFGAARLAAPRMMLHAWKLKFQHPAKETRWLSHSDDPPGDFQEFLATVRSGGAGPDETAPRKPAKAKKSPAATAEAPPAVRKAHGRPSRGAGEQRVSTRRDSRGNPRGKPATKRAAANKRRK